MSAKIVRHPHLAAAETATYLAKVWKGKVREIRRLAVFGAVLFLLGVASLYVSVSLGEAPQAEFYATLSFVLFALALLFGIGVPVGYRCDKKSHAKKTEAMTKIAKQK